MTGPALREALQLWARRPREMALANAASFAAVFLPLAAVPLLPPFLRSAALPFLALWAWIVFSTLCAACARMDAGEGSPGPWRSALAWLKAAWAERLAAFAVGALAALWLALALDFYRSRPLPPWLGWCLTALLGASGLWLALALLLSLGVAAEGGRPWRGVWKASALLPLAYAPAALAAAGLFFLALGLPALGLDLKRWSARLWLAPLMMSPFFTVAFLASYLTALVRAMFDHAEGRPSAGSSTWRELWSPWK